MTLNTVRRTVLTTVAGVAVATSMAACSATPAASTLADCPDMGIVTTVGIDATSSTVSEAMKSANLSMITKHVERTARCGGHVSVFAFASSTGATVPIFDGDLRVDAPTDNARIRKADKLAEQTNTTITHGYDVALAGVSGAGTDVLGMLTLLQQANAQFPDYAADNVLLTDGVTNIGVDPTGAVDVEAARALADQQSVPDLSGGSLKIVGIGKQAQGELPSAVVANLTAFWEQICRNTNAASCHVSTEGR